MRVLSRFTTRAGSTVEALDVTRPEARGEYRCGRSVRASDPLRAVGSIVIYDDAMSGTM